MIEHDDGEQGPDTDGLAAAAQRLNVAAHKGDDVWETAYRRWTRCVDVADLQARIARKEAANEALVAKLGATLADMQSLQRQNENWRAECQRLSALLVETQQQLAQRMAMPANALRWGGNVA